MRRVINILAATYREPFGRFLDDESDEGMTSWSKLAAFVPEVRGTNARAFAATTPPCTATPHHRTTAPPPHHRNTAAPPPHRRSTEALQHHASCGLVFWCTTNNPHHICRPRAVPVHVLFILISADDRPIQEAGKGYGRCHAHEPRQCDCRCPESTRIPVPSAVHIHSHTQMHAHSHIHKRRHASYTTQDTHTRIDTHSTHSRSRCQHFASHALAP